MQKDDFNMGEGRLEKEKEKKKRNEKRNKRMESIETFIFKSTIHEKGIARKQWRKPMVMARTYEYLL